MRRQRQQVLAAKGNSPAARRDQPHHRAQGRGFAGAVAAKKADHLAGRELKADAPQYLD